MPSATGGVGRCFLLVDPGAWMRVFEIRELVHSTSDPAFSVDGNGTIVAWNPAAEAFFGLPAQQALGKLCSDIVSGSDECGAVCTPGCTILQSIRKRRPVRNFDLQVRTPEGPRWCSVSVLLVTDGLSAPYSVHVLCNVDGRKRLELMVRGFLVSEVALSPEQAQALLGSTRTPTSAAALTRRELEVLRLLAAGASTADIAERLCLSRATVNNHVQHIFSKLDAHTRVGAVRRAERAGLI